MKKFLSILLAVCLIVSFVPLTASATGTNAFSYNETDYATLEAAVSQISANGSGTITMNGDVEYTADMYGESSFAMSVADGKNVTLDLNGHTLTAHKSGFKVGTWSRTTGTLTVINGKLVFDGTTAPAEGNYNNAFYVAGNNSTLNIGTSENSGEYNETTTKGLTVTAGAADTDSAGGVKALKGATVNVYGKIENLGVDSAIMGEGQAEDYGNINVNVYDGAVVSGGEAGIYFQNNTTLTISGGTVSGKTGVIIRSGNANITGGTIKGTGAKADVTEASGSYTGTGDALLVQNSDYPGGNPVVTISGGTFSSANADAIKVHTDGGKNGNGGSVTITGGTFSTNPMSYVSGDYTVKANSATSYSVYNASFVSSIADAPEEVTGDYKNPSGTTFTQFSASPETERKVTVTGELPYISGRDDTPNGNYLWVRATLADKDWTHVQVGSGNKIAKWDSFATDKNLDIHFKVNSSSNVILLTFYNNSTIVGMTPIYLDLTDATLAAAPSNNGGNGGTATTPDDDDNDVTDTDETPTTNTVTADDGTVTTTTTWSDGKTSTSVKDPDGNVTTTVKSASGETIAEISLPAEPNEGKTFSDVNGWSKEAITKATGYGLFAGTTATTFEPQTGMTRAMVAQVLYNISGKGDYGTDSKHYNDVSGSYADAINWATAAGVVSGNGDGTFEPEETVTREQLVTMLYNFAKAIGAVEKSSTGVENFPDGDETSDWATEAMNWAIANGIISGSTDNGVTTLNPRDTATREQVASVMVKFVEMLTK